MDWRWRIFRSKAVPQLSLARQSPSGASQESVGFGLKDEVFKSIGNFLSDRAVQSEV